MKIVNSNLSYHLYPFYSSLSIFKVKMSVDLHSLTKYLLKPTEEKAFGFLLVLFFTSIYVDGNLSFRNVFMCFSEAYLLNALLTLLPKQLKTMMTFAVSCILYLLAAVDSYCFLKLNTPISPTLVQLAIQTNSQEATEALREYITQDVLLSRFMLVLVLPFVVFLFDHWIRYKHLSHLSKNGKVIVMLCVFLGMPIWIANFTKAINILLSNSSIDLQEKMTIHYKSSFLPVYRLAYSIKANLIESGQLANCINSNNSIEDVSTLHSDLIVVLIIGESYNRHHASLYGYNLPTTPIQDSLRNNSSMVVFTDAISSWNMTSKSFQNMLSMHCIGERGSWSDYPLFPAIFMKAGFNVVFYTNQFVQSLNDHIGNFVGGVFLNNPQINNQCFNHRNSQKYEFDGELVHNCPISSSSKNQLIVFHLRGQHSSYNQRYPKEFELFSVNDYPNRNLTSSQKQMIAYYDNATLYNDYVIGEIVSFYKDKNAIIIHLADHGESVYDDDKHVGRYMTQSIRSRGLLSQQFDIPMWIWASSRYVSENREKWQRIKESAQKPFMSDLLGHLMLSLADIESKWYKDELDIISPAYSKRKRIVNEALNY